jgi:putative tryptophan/tyrosine transport system substrate-binding protein
MRRREFISLLTGAAAWPLAAQAQPTDRTPRIAALMGWSDDTVHRSYFEAAIRGLAQLGWVEGRNVVIDVRWTGGNVDQARVFAKELVASQPDMIFTTTTPLTAAAQMATNAIPIIFVSVSDPVGAGFVRTLSRPGGNITGTLSISKTQWVVSGQTC